MSDNKMLSGQQERSQKEVRGRILPTDNAPPAETDDEFAWLQRSLMHTIGIEADDQQCWGSLYREVAAADDLVEAMGDQEPWEAPHAF